MAMRWYAIHTLSGSEEKARKALEQRIAMHGLDDRFGKVLVPSETVVDPKTKRKITRRFYPGYMLVQMVREISGDPSLLPRAQEGLLGCLIGLLCILAIWAFAYFCAWLYYG